jgi:D-glycero-alpha-D-manno-heptose-7-phosphate kinase
VIITRTPYRISLTGGGTDLPSFYRKEYGAVLSFALDKHMYVTVSPRFDPTTRVAYTRTEVASDINQIEHTIVREALRKTGLGRHLEITTVGDVPAGTGLGSSSSLTVGLLNALYAYRGEVSSPMKLASQACEIEIELLKKPIGKQDQFAAAFGGINYIRFNPDESVDVEPVPCRPETMAELTSHSMLLYTEMQRDADRILQQQSDQTNDRRTVLRAMRDLCVDMRHALAGVTDIRRIGEILDEGWQLKRSLGFGISMQMVDTWYETAKRLGAYGGKLLGAGGGGFLMLLAPPDAQERIRAELGRPKELEFGIDRSGSRVIFISDHNRLLKNQ